MSHTKRLQIRKSLFGRICDQILFLVYECGVQGGGDNPARSVLEVFSEHIIIFQFDPGGRAFQIFVFLISIIMSRLYPFDQGIFIDHDLAAILLDPVIFYIHQCSLFFYYITAFYLRIIFSRRGLYDEHTPEDRAQKDTHQILGPSGE